MSNSRFRARARHKKICAEFEAARQNPKVFAELLCRLAQTDVALWKLAKSAVGEKPLDEAESAMISHLVAAPLAGMTPGNVKRRLQLGE